MIKKQISKITMMASLLLAGMVNAQEFYTCVPKKSWWSDVMTESVEKGIDKTKVKKWRLIEEFDAKHGKTFPLNFGRYKLEYIGDTASGIHEFRSSDSQYIKTIFESGTGIGKWATPNIWTISTPDGENIEVLDSWLVKLKLYKYE